MNETAAESLCVSSSKNQSDGVVDDDEDVRISELRKISYGFIMPTICLLGIVGNVLNLVVLTRRNMQGRAYIYMRAYSTASLVAISFCIPFALRVLIAKEKGGWTSWFQAFYHVHLELYLGNSCLGICVMTLLALTVERHASVCRMRPTSNLAASGATFQRGLSPRLTLLLLALGTFFLYLPTIFRAEMSSCISARLNHQRLYQQRDNRPLLQSAFYQVSYAYIGLLYNYICAERLTI
ncbi:hypothetical protein TSAR_011758 [Trichomalopsis sarcophagae]|uniref:G-protein coupled receptors family 1 profile domain-containing protein n=1 Tax=Trichomalopsis sarcophagae TaxID=543379 RepID=A0A232EUN6_9HYME|nr:hypothetical protein TSAR_011758 [Trichomalopsis sarcophagae]